MNQRLRVQCMFAAVSFQLGGWLWYLLTGKPVIALHLMTLAWLFLWASTGYRDGDDMMTGSSG